MAASGTAVSTSSCSSRRGGTRKLANMRPGPAMTVVARAGWEWAAVEGAVELIGPDDPFAGVDAERAPPAVARGVRCRGRNARRLGRVRPRSWRGSPRGRAGHARRGCIRTGERHDVEMSQRRSSVPVGLLAPMPSEMSARSLKAMSLATRRRRRCIAAPSGATELVAAKTGIGNAARGGGDRTAARHRSTSTTSWSSASRAAWARARSAT